ncbi:hypothetical protein HA402_009107 [Bradysia odoriphaga]|nr:hypothetical protein HA402_009107 [Bradysia odoriphaga]
MANRDVFSKVLPNIKLSTVFDSEGKEIQVERREDAEQNAKQQEIYDILVAAGYFRARIKGLSAFDKIVGGMTWCIEASDFDVDVDLLFHENLSIGQKIALTEKIVNVLPKMQCPCSIEPHQIQGLDFIKIFPVIQWLVKRSVENRTERAEKLKRFATSQFQNNFQFECDVKSRDMYANSSQCVRQILGIDAPKRQYKRKEAGPDDEKTRVRITLLEYGNKSLIGPSFGVTALKKSESDAVVEDEFAAEIDVAQLLKNLYVANEDECLNHSELTETEKHALTKHYAELRNEMSADVKQLSERSQIKNLETTKLALERKLQKIQEDNRAMEKRLAEEKHSVDLLISEGKDIKAEIRSFEGQDNKCDKGILDNIQKLVIKNEELKQAEMVFKDQCRQEMARIQREIKEAEQVTPEEDIRESLQVLEMEREKLQTIRLQLAKKNRAIVSIQRQLDNIPSRTELSQYQRRFLELYNQVSAKHRETKQFYTMYNTLDDTKRYLTKELSLLNSIHENYNDGMANPQSKEQFVTQLETIVDGVKQTKIKVKNKFEDERAKRDGLNSQLMCLIEQQRKYATVVKQFTNECQRNEHMTQQLKALQV